MTDTNTLKKSLLMIKKLKKLLQEQNNKFFEPVAIIGMSCRIPQANTPQKLWELLCQGKNVITPLPEERWHLLENTHEPLERNRNWPYWGGYLDNIPAFDAYFFGISPREAVRMDPQQRILLEVNYEAFADAGYPVEDLAGSHTGVFSSLYASQFSHWQTLDSDMDALLIPTGGAISIAANRFSYLFDLRGPSMVLDTACSSSLIAVQLACLHLQAKLCEQALVSAININLLPSVHSVLAKATMLSPTGQCHTFDAKADGYVQGEGAGALILKPLSKAVRDKDRIYAVIAGSAVNQDGKTNGLTAPNGLQQEELLRSAYKAAGLDPAVVSYVECHGTGTLLGDPIEVQALGEVVAKTRKEQQPCWIGSVKTNIGHLEPAAGVLSLIKTALILTNEKIPPHLNYTTANPHIPFDKYRFKIPQHLEALPKYHDYAVAGVSGFGFGGANAHIVLRSPLAEEQQTLTNLPKDQELFTISAKDAGGLDALINQWIDFLTGQPELNLAQICYHLHLRRPHYSKRLAIIAHSTEDLLEKLHQARAKVPYPDVFMSDESKKENKAPISEFSAMDLPVLVTHYVNGVCIDWKKYEEGRFYPHVDLPHYPWQHKLYWPQLGRRHEVINSTYPLQGKFLSSPLSVRQFEFALNSNTLPEIKDTLHVLHAGYYIDMLCFAVNQLQQKNGLSVEKLSFLSPLLVLEGKEVQLQLVMEPQEEQSFICRFFSNENKKQWLENAQGILSTNAIQPKSIPSCDFRQQSLADADSESFYQRINQMGMPAGETIRWVEHYWLRKNEFFGTLRKPKTTERGEAFMLKVHPGIIDACIQTVFLMLPDETTQPYMASQLGQVNVYGNTGEPAYVYTVLKELDTEGKTLKGDWFLLDKEYRLIIQCTDFCLSQLNELIPVEAMEAHSTLNLDLTKPYEECKSRLVTYLTEQISFIFSMPREDISITDSLLNLGMDSLMALALFRAIESSLEVTYPLPNLMQGPSIQNIAEAVLAEKLAHFSPQVIETEKKDTTIWFANRVPQEQAKLRLFCFPYGGGGASIYREWQNELHGFIEVCPIQLPGRENRMEEPPMQDMQALVSLLATHLEPYFNLPFAFFGHSFGALIAFEFIRHLRRHEKRLPIHFFASAYPDPRLPSRSLDDLLTQLAQEGIYLFDLGEKQIEQLSDEHLTRLAWVFKEHGIVDYSDERMNKSIIKILLPIFIGDMRLVKNYIYQPEPPLHLKTSVFIGKQDTWVRPKDHLGWAAHSLLPCQFHYVDSGHLFIREKNIRSQVIQKLNSELQSYIQEAIEF